MKKQLIVNGILAITLYFLGFSLMDLELWKELLIFTSFVIGIFFQTQEPIKFNTETKSTANSEDKQ